MLIKIGYRLITELKSEPDGLKIMKRHFCISANASGASLDGITPQPPAAAAEQRRRSSLRKASQIDRNLYANRVSKKLKKLKLK